MTDRWFDDAAGPVVRPYAMTRGRTRSTAGDAERLDLIALVIADEPAPGSRGAGREPRPDPAPPAPAPAGDGRVLGRRTVALDTIDPMDPVDPPPVARREPGNAPDAGEAADGEAEDPLDDAALAPEHIEIVKLCRAADLSVAELATELDLPVGVVRVLIGDLLEAGLVRVTRPVPPAELPDVSILREVINGLRAL